MYQNPVGKRLFCPSAQGSPAPRGAYGSEGCPAAAAVGPPAAAAGALSAAACPGTGIRDRGGAMPMAAGVAASAIPNPYRRADPPGRPGLGKLLP